MILGVHHPAISVPNMEEALAFYGDKLGFEVIMNIELPSMEGIGKRSPVFSTADTYHSDN